ncbi:MAG: LUD domain-containing protein [Pirellulales bacterium]
MKREAFIERVRQAARAGQAHRAHVRTGLPDSVGYVGGGADLCCRLAEEVVGVGGTAVVVETLEAARVALAVLLDNLQPTSALCWRHPLLEQLELTELLAAHNVEPYDFGRLAELEASERRRAILAAGIGITSVAAAIAETGTLVLAAEPGRERVASLLAPVHVAIVAESQILPDLFDLFASLDRAVGCVKQSADAPPLRAKAREAGAPSASLRWPLAGDGESGEKSRLLPSNLVLITGPSKTGDIELQLTTGVHGPGKVHVIVIRGR